MSNPDLNWSAAAEEAARIAEGWRENEPGGAIALFDARTIRSETCGGLADLASGDRFAPDTVSRYASITKHVFAAMLLAHDDRIGLDDALGAHLPDLRAPMADVAVGRALDMTGGLPDLRETLALLGVPLATVVDGPALLDFLARDGAVNAPTGTEISYSNTGYRLAEAALRAKGVDFESHLQSRINRALGIAFHAPERWADPVVKLAPGYWKADDGWRLATAGMQLSASGCLTGSVRDLAGWLQALMADRDPARGALARLAQTRRLADGRATDYGLGLAHTRLGARRLVGHGGSHAGYKAYFLLNADAQAGVALVSNREDVNSFGAALRIMAALVGDAPPPQGSSLVDGLYATERGPFWLEAKNGAATFLGTGETLHRGADGANVSLSAHFPMRLAQQGDAIVGEVGFRSHRFQNVTARATDPAAFDVAQGEWICAAHRATFAVQGDRFVMGVGPTVSAAPLTPLGGGRFIAEIADGPWPRRFCASFDGDEAQLATNRSRMLRFRRA